MSAKIMRLVRNVDTIHGAPNPAFDPERQAFWTECLSRDDPPEWSEDLDQAVRFPTHHEAEARAAALTAAGTHCFARTIERDPNQRDTTSIFPPSSTLDVERSTLDVSPKKRPKRKKPSAKNPSPTKEPPRYWWQTSTAMD